MYKELFEKNKDAIVFLKEEECLDDSEINSISPMRHTKLNSKTIVGIADLMTRFAEKQANGVDKTPDVALPIPVVSNRTWSVPEIVEELKEIDEFNAARYFFDKYGC